jgi:hypothetical protein
MIPMRNYYRTDVPTRIKARYDHRFRYTLKKREAFKNDRQKIIHVWWSDWPTEDEVRAILWEPIHCVDFHRKQST